jgi:hypothetical protein
MSAYSRNMQLAAYQSVAAHGGVAQTIRTQRRRDGWRAAAHRRGAVARARERAQKAQLLQRAP